MDTIQVSGAPICRRCGGTLALTDEHYTCQYCGRTCDIPGAEGDQAIMQRLFDEAKRELISRLRRRLYDAVTAAYVSREDVKDACDDLLSIFPEDITANFYKSTLDHDPREINRAIESIDVKAQYEDIGVIVTYLVRAMTADEDYLLALNDLVDRAYKSRDLTLYNHYATMISEQAERVRAGVYETCVPRDVFVAYSSKDMKHVTALVEELERQGISCFVAARNLRHGVGSVENYDQALKEAMDNCHSVVFLSSQSSRNFACDALKIELAYIRNEDMENAPPEYRHSYEKMPHEYKKPRVEYRLEESNRPGAADEVINQFFSGYERVYTAEAVASRVAEQLCDIPKLVHMDPSSQKKRKSAPPKTVSLLPDRDAKDLLERAALFLSAGNWQEAERYADQALEQDSTCGEAYLCKLMADLQIRQKEDLKSAEMPLSSHTGFNHALRYGDRALTKFLQASAQKQEKMYARQATGKKAALHLLTGLFVLLLLATAFMALAIGFGMTQDPQIAIPLALIIAVGDFFAIRGIFRKKKKLKLALQQLQEKLS